MSNGLIAHSANGGLAGEQRRLAGGSGTTTTP